MTCAGRILAVGQASPGGVGGRLTIDLPALRPITAGLRRWPPAECALAEGDWLEVIGPHQSINAPAADAGTIADEILANLGRRDAIDVIPCGSSAKART